MTYALALGTVDAWDYVWAHTLTTSDVLILRLAVKGCPMKQPADALLFARAGGQGQNLGLDVRAVAVQQDAGSDEAQVDIIFTSPIWRLLAAAITQWADQAGDMAKKVLADEGLRGVFPKLTVDSAMFGQLTEPADAIDHWRSQPVLWDHALPGPKNLGGPTDSMAKPADYSVVKGEADDGARTKPWKPSVLSLLPGAGILSQVTSSPGGMIALGVGAAAIGFMVFNSKGRGAGK